MRICKPLDWQVNGSTGMDVVAEGAPHGEFDCVLWIADHYFGIPPGQRPVLARTPMHLVQPGLAHARFAGLEGWGRCVLGCVSRRDGSEGAVCGVHLGGPPPQGWLSSRLHLGAEEAARGLRHPVPITACPLSHIPGEAAEPVGIAPDLPTLLTRQGGPPVTVLPLVAPEVIDARAVLDDTVNLAPDPAKADSLLQQSPYRASAPYVALMQDVVAMLPAGLVMPRGDRIWSDSTHAAFWQDPNCAFSANLFRTEAGLGFVPDRMLTEQDLMQDNELERLPGIPLLAFSNAWRNHGHWLMNTVFAAWLLRDAIRRGEVCVLVPESSDYIQDTLRAAGIPRRAILLARPGTYRLARALYPSTLSIHANTFPPRAMAGMYREMAARVAAQAGTPGPERIVLTRIGSGSQRTIGNELDLIEALRRRGFVCIAPHELGFADEVRCFGRARVIVGQLGAGMLNIGFAPAGCRVIEIASDNYGANDTWFLAAVMGQRYSRLVVDGGRAEATTLTGFRFDVPLAAALSLIDDVLTRIDPAQPGREDPWPSSQS